MKRFGAVLMAALLFGGCANEDKFILEGAFEHSAPQAKVYLFAMDKANPIPLDSTVLSDKGEFKFKHETEGVDFFKVTVGSNEYMIIAKNGDRIQLNADLDDKDMHYSLSGAEEADKLQDLNTTKNKHIQKLAEIKQLFDDQVAKEPAKRQQIIERLMPGYTKEAEQLDAAILKFAQDNPTTLTGFYAINLLNPSVYEKEMIAYSDKIGSTFGKNAAVVEFLTRMAKLKSVQTGAIAPDFTINTIEGKNIKLSDFKGKYVLLDFWASWCGPCREENPNVVQAYKNYKDRNFTILSVSLDKDPKQWKQAIQTDGLTWTHAGELQDFDGPSVKLFQVEAIPASFLIDPSGKIIAKNLRAADLQSFLNKSLPKL